MEHELPGYGWTVPKIIELVKQMFERRASRTKMRTLLKRHGLSWKTCRKVLLKADPEKRKAFIEQFQLVFEQVCQNQVILLYIDEAHLHRDMDLGYTWAPKGKPVYRMSACAPLSDRINWYGAYNLTDGQCLIWNEGSCNTDHTLAFLEKVAEWLGPPQHPVLIIWDGAPWHRAIRIREQAEKLGFQLLPLPGYSPDLNPIEGLWKWMREEVTQLYCHPSVHALAVACRAFIDRINLNPEQIIGRLWPKFDLDPDCEKLLVSN